MTVWNPPCNDFQIVFSLNNVPSLIVLFLTLTVGITEEIHKVCSYISKRFLLLLFFPNLKIPLLINECRPLYGKTNTLVTCLSGNIHCWRQKCHVPFIKACYCLLKSPSKFLSSLTDSTIIFFIHVAFSFRLSPSLLPSLPCGLLSSCSVHQLHLRLISLPPPPAFLLPSFRFHSHPFVFSSSLSCSSAPILISKASPLLLPNCLRV